MGQFGSLYDAYQNQNNDHNGWISANYRLSDTTTLHGQFILTEASSSFSGLNLDASTLVGTPPGFNYSDLTELQDYSHLRMRWYYLDGGLKQLMAQRYALEAALTYQDYNDYQPYLVDTTGSRFGVLTRINFLF